MIFKHSAIFYTLIYLIVAVVLYFAQQVLGFYIFPVVFGLPFLYALTLGLNYFLHQSVLSRPTMMVNAIMLTSMGRLLGFGGAIVFTVFAYRDILGIAVPIYSFLYLVSLGGDIFFVKRFKV